MRVKECKWIIRATTFASAAHCYWSRVFPQTQAELVRWRHRARHIPDSVLREAAFDSLRTKRSDLEGAVAFAVFAPRPLRRDVVRAISAFEIAFDYMDSVGELPNSDPIAAGGCLNQALHVAVSPGAKHPDYYRHCRRREDAGYLEDLVRTCQTAVARLPSFAAIAKPLHRAVSRIVTYQTLNHSDANDSHDVFRQWANSHAVQGIDLRWWELGAATGSQLSVLSLIAAASDPRMCPDRAIALERAYFPWVGALSTLLDGVIDQERDSAEGKRRLIDHYASPEETATRLSQLAREALRAMLPLSDAPQHTMLLEAMAAFFHATPQALTPNVSVTTQAVVDAMGAWTVPPLLFFRTRRALARTKARL